MNLNPGIRVCILVTTENVEKARENAKNIDQFKDRDVFKILLSPTGTLPVTHWFCTFNSSQEVYDKMTKIVKYSEIECCDPHKFLEKKGLKVIKSNELKVK